ncbi:hypothetical protein Srubr_20150 [Streptomyces rubradiris]|uniref:Secreted protein n=1 Tax=Streptomyces rubradiris TaxID=285531 RepID=A0ABQ3R8J0_STRRR|nr:hypothetical protein GCM10018792_59890 [Streptomyces rubradiris]GHI52169.1 hypothetical protein Srubr_20150 [Streptomyces rubradiris]
MRVASGAAAWLGVGTEGPDGLGSCCVLVALCVLFPPGVEGGNWVRAAVRTVGSAVVSRLVFPFRSDMSAFMVFAMPLLF